MATGLLGASFAHGVFCPETGPQIAPIRAAAISRSSKGCQWASASMRRRWRSSMKPLAMAWAGEGNRGFCGRLQERVKQFGA